MSYLSSRKEVLETFASVYKAKNKWKTVTDAHLRKHPELADELYKLLSTAYASIGGHSVIKSPSQLVGGKISVIHAVDIDADPEADAVSFGKKKPAGIKSVGLGHDGTRAAKDRVMAYKAKLLKSKKQYAEMSGAIAHIMLTRYGVDSVNDEETVQKALNKDIEWIGAHPKGKYPDNPGWYRRTIGGERHLKILMGLPLKGKKKTEEVGEVWDLEEEERAGEEALMSAHKRAGAAMHKVLGGKYGPVGSGWSTSTGWKVKDKLMHLEVGGNWLPKPGAYWVYLKAVGPSFDKSPTLNKMLRHAKKLMDRKLGNSLGKYGKFSKTNIGNGMAVTGVTVPEERMGDLTKRLPSIAQQWAKDMKAVGEASAANVLEHVELDESFDPGDFWHLKRGSVDVWFYPVASQKNGGYKGLELDLSFSRKPKKKSVDRLSHPTGSRPMYRKEDPPESIRKYFKGHDWYQEDADDEHAFALSEGKVADRIMELLRSRGGSAAVADLAKDIRGSHYASIERAAKHLVKQGKLTLRQDPHEGMILTFSEAVCEPPEKILSEEVDADYAKAHAATTPEELVRVFERLKSKQKVWMSYGAVMSMAGKAYRPYVVGRRSRSKKYDVTSITMLTAGEKPGRYMKIKLRRHGEGSVGVALGDMGASLLGLYVDK